MGATTKKRPRYRVESLRREARDMETLATRGWRPISGDTTTVTMQDTHPRHGGASGRSIECGQRGAMSAKWTSALRLDNYAPHR